MKEKLRKEALLMELSTAQRLILFNQFEILKRLSEDEYDEKMYQNDMDILLNGFESEYDSLIKGFDVVPLEICQEVKDILFMFRCLNDSYDNLSDKEDIDERLVKFRGFDGNEEPDHYAFAKWFINDKRYCEFKNAEMNSHSNRLRIYRPMLATFKPYEEASILTNLSAKQIKEIINSYK